MRTSPMLAISLGAVLAGPVPAAAQPAPTSLPPESLRLRATSPSAFSGPCVPPAKITFEGSVEASAPIPWKYATEQLIFSDGTVVELTDHTLSPDRRTLTVRGARSFEKTFDGWALLQFQKNPDLRPRDSGRVALKVSCTAPALGGPKVPPPSTPGR